MQGCATMSVSGDYVGLPSGIWCSIIHVWGSHAQICMDQNVML